MSVAALADTSGKPNFLDRVNDLDTHEVIPHHMWGEFYGEEIGRRLAHLDTHRFFSDNGANTIVRPDILSDSTEIDDDSVWATKGPSAPSAFDLRRRVAVLDQMGVDKSILFPGFGMIALLMAAAPEFASSVVDMGMDPAMTRETGLMGIKAYNETAIRSVNGLDPRRVRRVGIIPTEDIGEMMASLEHLVENGVKAVWIPSGIPPCGTSPADAVLDPFWKLASDANVAVLLHIGGDFSFTASQAWGANVPAFFPPKASAEFVISPFAGATMSFATETFLSAIVLGGVFERFPNLRFGVIELGAQWFGPLADRLDMWAEIYPKALRGTLSTKPSDYMARNVRVTPFHFEQVGPYFDRYPHLEDCYCYSSDYPHVEGGVGAKASFAEMLRGHDERVLEKFFVTNGEWLVPDA